MRITGFPDGLFIASVSHPANTHALNIDQQIYTTYIISHPSHLVCCFVAAILHGPFSYKDAIETIETTETLPFSTDNPLRRVPAPYYRFGPFAGLTHLAKIGRSLPTLHSMCTLDLAAHIIEKFMHGMRVRAATGREAT